VYESNYYDKATFEDTSKNCNVLQVKYLSKMFVFWRKAMNQVVDGDKARKGLDAEPDIDEKTEKFAGKWVYDWNPGLGYTAANGYQRRCKMRGPTCNAQSIFQILGASHEEKDANFFVGKTDADIMALVNNATARGVKQSTLDATFSSETKGAVNPATGKYEYTSVSHVFGVWELNEDFYLTDKNREIDPIGQEWERQVLCDVFGVQSRDGRQDCRDSPGQPKGVGFALFFKRSLGDEFGRAIVGDLGNMAIAYILMITYLCVMIGKKDSVHSMVAMGFVALGAITLSILAGEGTCYFFGVPKNNMTGLLPFLIVGLGVDDAFVLVNEYWRAEATFGDTLSFEEKIGKMVEFGGMSILVTSVTDCLAFLIGTLNSIPALSWFCWLAAWSVFYIFILQLTIFVPALAWNKLRTDKNRLDCCCCWAVIPMELQPSEDETKGLVGEPQAAQAPRETGEGSTVPKEQDGSQSQSTASTKSETDTEKVSKDKASSGSDKKKKVNKPAAKPLPEGYGTCCPCACFNIEGSKHQLFEPQGCCNCIAGPSLCCGTGNNLREILTWITKKQLTKPGKIITLLVAFTVMCIGCYGLPFLDREFQLEWFIPAGSYVLKFYDFNDKYFATPKRSNVYIRKSNKLQPVDLVACMRRIDATQDTADKMDQTLMEASWFGKYAAYTKAMTDVATGGTAYGDGTPVELAPGGSDGAGADGIAHNPDLPLS